MSTKFGAPPVIPAEFEQYNSYVTDPHYARIFTLFWTCALAFFVLVLSVPSLIRLLANPRARRGGKELMWKEMRARLVGVRDERAGREAEEEDREINGDDTLQDAVKAPRSRKTILGEIRRELNRARALFYWSVPWLGLNLGQFIIVSGYILTVVVCTFLDAPLIKNPNRPGFIALALLPPLFLFGAKNSPLTILLPAAFSSSFAYDRMNFLHRESGHLLSLCAFTHGALWIKNRLKYDLPILGKPMEMTGIAALVALALIVATSLGVVRRRAWRVFWFVHVLAFPAFLIASYCHTSHSVPWLIPPLILYALDLLARFVKHRSLDAFLVAVDDNMTLLHIPNLSSGWRAGQHVHLRIFPRLSLLTRASQILESHPLSIYTAPSDVSCISLGFTPNPTLNSEPGAPADRTSEERAIYSGPGENEATLESYESSEKSALVGIPGSTSGASIPNREGLAFGIRVAGDWSRAINQYARSSGTSHPSSRTTYPPTSGVIKAPVPIPVRVSLSGPYGGCTLDLGDYETVLLIAGGSGVTFTLSLLDDIVGRCVHKGRQRGEITRRIEFVWYVRSYDAINWFASALTDIANAAARSSTLELHISVYVTRPCNSDSVPPIPNCDVISMRPSVTHLLKNFTTPCSGVQAIEARQKVVPRPAVDSLLPVSSSRINPRDESPDDFDVEDQEDLEDFDLEQKLIGVDITLPRVAENGSLAVCASGPDGLVRETADAVTTLQLSSRGRRLGEVGLHTDAFMI